ncbi:MAG: glutathione S-transferase family protein [Pseudomonadota bacterium]
MGADQMLFYDYARAPSPRRVRIFIAEKGVDIPVQQVDLGAHENLGAEYLEKNPDGTVPALALDDGTVLSESLAISAYLEAVYPEPPLLGRTDLERAEILMWNARIEQQWLGAVAESYRNHSRGFVGRSLTGPDNYEQVSVLVPRGRQRAEAFMQRMDAHLAGSPFVVGDAFSLADITALVTVDMSAWIKLPIAEQHGNLQRWYDTVSQRPSAKA